MLSDYKYFALFYLVLVSLPRWLLSLFKLPSYFSWLCSYLPIYWIIAIPKMYATDLMMGPSVKSFLALLCHNSAIIICFTTFWVVSYFWKIHVFLHLLFLHEVHLKHRLINKCNDLCLWSLTFYIRIFGPDTLLCEQGGCSHRSVHFGSWGGNHTEVSW